MNFDNVLNLTPSSKLNEWREVIRKTLASGNDVIWVGDTETTGLEPKGDQNNRGLKDRLLEVGMIAYVGKNSIIDDALLDSEGGKIYFHEYINPFIEETKILERYHSTQIINYGSFLVHGITKEFLEGKSGLYNSNKEETNFKLSKPAPTFSELKPAIEWLACLDLSNELLGKNYFLAHNCEFDAQFLDFEWAKTELLHENNTEYSFFESHFGLIDSLELIKEMYSRNEIIAAAAARPLLMEKINQQTTKIKPSFQLDFLRYFYEVDEIERDMHGALIDSVILAEVYKKMCTDKKYLNFPVIKNMIRTPLEKKIASEEGLISL